MEIIIALAIAALAAIFISIPFFFRSNKKSAAEYFPDRRQEKLRALQSQKDSLLTAIKDIEFDRGLGKLTAEDFEELRGKYRHEAAAVLKEIDELGKGDPARDESEDIEREISAERMKLLTSYDDEELEKEILRAREVRWNASGGTIFCSECGSACGEEDLFCSKCGAGLNAVTENKNAG